MTKINEEPVASECTFVPQAIGAGKKMQRQ